MKIPSFPVMNVDVVPYAGPMREVAIYGLVDPRDLTVRYVGSTTNMHARVTSHRGARTENGRKSAWIAALRSFGKEPLMMIIDSVSVDDAESAERSCIERLRSNGRRLLNGARTGAKRPRMKPMGSCVILHIAVPLELKVQIDVAVAREQEPNLSKWMRRAARSEIERQAAAEKSKKGGGR